MGMHKSARNDVTAGQHVNHDYRTQAEAVVNLPEVTLADYLNNRDKLYKEKMTFNEWWDTVGCDLHFKHETAWRTAEAAWNASNKSYKEKMSFDQWFNFRYKNQNWLHKDLKNSMYRALQECWNAAKENKYSWGRET